MINRWPKVLLYLLTAGLFLSGVLWWIFDIYVVAKGSIGEESQILQSWFLKSHGLLAPSFLILFGYLIPSHMQKLIPKGRNLVLGWTLVTLFCILIASGYLLYYLGSENLREFTSFIHLTIGFVIPIALILHVVNGKRTPRRPSL